PGVATTTKLPGQRLRSPLIKDAIFEAAFSTAWPPFLADHKVYNTLVVPGACYALMALAAAREALAGKLPTLAHVSFSEALLIDAERPRMVQTIVSPTGDGAVLFQVFSRSAASQGDDTPWTLHASGRLQDAPAAGLLESGILAAAQTRCQEQIASEEFYRAAYERGLAFGPGFQWIEQLWRGNGESLCQLRPARPADRANEYLIHPGLIDACFQAAGATAPVQPTDRSPVPVGIERLQLRGEPDSGVWCYAIARPGSTAELLVADVRLL